MSDARPAATVIVPFAGTRAALRILLDALAGLRTTGADAVIVAVNHAPHGPGFAGVTQRHATPITIVDAPGILTPGFARNAGAAHAGTEWLVFIDADTRPAPNLLDAYLSIPPAPGTAILAGTIIDVAPSPSRAALHSVARAHLSQRVTLDRGAFPYAQTANCAIRADAFREARGFAERARAGEDADLCFRLAARGYRLEERPHAIVEHDVRATTGELLAQLARHGSGAAWCNRRHPDSFPPATPRELLGRIRRAPRHASPELEVLTALAFAFGRLLPNERRLPRNPRGYALR